MQSPCLREASQACFHGCCTNPILGFSESPNPKSKSITTVATSRIDFATATTSSLFPETQFTNHECLPSLSESLSQFNKAYPQYRMTEHADSIRAQEYYHLSLSNHVCLDYTGLGLFSHSQQQARCSLNATVASTSVSPPSLPTCNSEFPFFNVCYKSASLKSQVLYGGQESELETAMKRRIMAFLNICENDYSMVFTANRTAAFKLLAESYPFQSNRRLLTVYDHESEAAGSMIDNSQKRGAKVMSAEFSWPSMRIQSTKLRKMVESKRKKKARGLFVFPLQSMMTGTRYSCLWMSMAQANGWHVALDASALGAKDMDTLGLSLIQPDFLICSLYKVFGENPSGFGCLFVKKSSAKVLEASTMARSIGIASLVPVKRTYPLLGDSSDSDSDTQQKAEFGEQEDVLPITSSYSGPISAQVEIRDDKCLSSTERHNEESEHGETSELRETEPCTEQMNYLTSEIVEVPSDSVKLETTQINTAEADRKVSIECRGLDHADSLGLINISTRARCQINWVVNALSKLQHPHTEKGLPLVQIYGPKIKFDRGPALSFNVFDWKGEKVEPVLVQKLADRSNISLSYGFLNNLWFSDKYEAEKERVVETRLRGTDGTAQSKRKEKVDIGITVVTAALGFLNNFEDIYRLWAFVAQFLDADFVEKERWRYMALNQNIVEV
ncbi:hypothetical protein IFM89_020628 [Coptis chinensis]|uniref:Molybdenum cofactor sulfurase n=1 Tax=Coptis chinensis TaxID=261450 RepID=A0A835ICS2_9MAGN|nr:hypothetical protein IFM89_020628 [Coptis chinensis]